MEAIRNIWWRLIITASWTLQYIVSIDASDAVHNTAEALVVDEWTNSQKCLPYSWKDYTVEVTDHMAHDNIIFEAVDVESEAEGYKLEALSVHVFKEVIPADRNTALSARRAIHTIYEVGLTSHDVQQGRYFLSVLCGPTATTFMVRVRDVPGEFQGDGDTISGQVCPGMWGYHQFTVPAAEDNIRAGAHVRLEITTEAYIYGLMHLDDPPLHLVAPYFLLAANQSNTITTCNVHEGTTYFLGIKGDKECTGYDVSLHYFDSEVCEVEESEHALGHHGLEELRVNHFLQKQSSADAVHDFHLAVSEVEALESNLVVEVEDLAGALHMHGLTVSLYVGSIPPDRKTEFSVSYTGDKLYSLAINAHDLEAGDYYVAVQANGQATTFRVLVRLVQAKMLIGEHVNGVVCPGELIYHFFDNSEGVSTHINASVTASPDHRRKALATAHATEPSLLSVDGSIRFKLTLHSGDLYYSVSHLHPMLKLVPPYRRVDYLLHQNRSTPYTDVDICNIEYGLQYVSLKGGDSCSEYEVELFQISEFDSCHEVEHECLEACAVLCQELTNNHFHYASCEPNSWNDYMFTVTEADLRKNMIVEVDTMFGTSNARDFEALGLYMWYNELPSVRESDIKSIYSVEQSWALAVSAHDIKVGNYFFSVKCGPEPVTYRILLELTHALVEDGELTKGLVCPDDWVYHYAQIGDVAFHSSFTDSGGLGMSHNYPPSPGTPSDSSTGSKKLLASAAPALDGAGQRHHVQFTLTVYSGDVYYLARSEHAPIKLVPPYRWVDYLEQMVDHRSTQVMLCNVSAGTHYLGLYGGKACSNYEIQMDLLPASEPCAALAHDLSLSADAHAGMTQLHSGHSVRGSCQPHAFTDYFLYVTEELAEDNLVLEVHDLLPSLDTTALEVYLYYGSIPPDRISQRSSKFTSDHIYSITVNQWDIQTGEYFLSVKCGAKAVDYTVVTELFHARMLPGDHVAGEVCPGEMVFHYIDLPPNDNGHDAGHVEFTLVLHEGNVRYKLQHKTPALKMFPPYATAHSERHLHGGNTTIQTCHVDYGRWWLSLRAIDKCSEYDIYSQLHHYDDPCDEYIHEVEVQAVAAELTERHFYYEECNPNSYIDFHVNLHMDIMDNFLVEVEDLGGDINTGALSMFMYKDSIPQDRASEYRTEYSDSSIWTLSLNSHDVSNGDYYISVKCGAEGRRFRVVYFLISAQLEEDVWVEAEVCPRDWVHHYLDISRLQEGGNLSHGATASVEFDIMVHEGNMYYLLRPDEAPTRIVPPYRFADSHTLNKEVVHASFCHIQDYPTVHKYFLSLLGGSKCTHYAIRARVVKKCEHAFSHDTSLQGLGSTVTDLEIGKHTYGSCRPNSYVDYSFTISAALEVNNLVLEVEDLNSNNDPGSLVLELYTNQQSIPQVRDPDLQVDTARNKLYTISLDYVQLQAGKYLASVRCTSEAVRFRVTVALVTSKILDRQYVPGSVAPNDWTFHYYVRSSTDSDKHNVRFHVTIYFGEVYMVLARNDRPPGFAIRQKNEFMWRMNGATSLSVDLCDVSERGYLGLHGGELVSKYAIYAEAYNPGDISSFDGSVLASEDQSNCKDYVLSKPGYIQSGSNSHFSPPGAKTVFCGTFWGMLALLTLEH